VIYYKYNFELRNLLNFMIRIRVIYMLKLFRETEMFIIVMFLINLSPILQSFVGKKPLQCSAIINTILVFMHKKCIAGAVAINR